MIEKIKQQPMELWLGLIAMGAYILEQDKTLIVMSIIYLTTARILSELRNK